MKWLISALLLAFACAADAQPGRIVSLDYCADQFVLGLANRDQIVALSADSQRAFSHLRADAKGIPQVRADAESLLALEPDLVVRAWGGDAHLLGLLKRAGIPTHEIGYAASIDDAVALTRTAGRVFGQSERTEMRLAALPKPRAPLNRSALYLTPGGVTAGEGTLIGDMMRRAGLDNAETKPGWSSYSLEDLVRHPPHFIVSAFFGFDTDRRDAWSPSRHPVLGNILSDATVVEIDEARVSCPAWFVAEEADALATRAGEGQ